MTDSRKVQLEAGLGTSGVKQGAGEIKDALRDVAQTAQQQSAVAAKAVDGIGDGGSAAAKKVDNATRSIAGSIERATAALQAGERGTAAYFETLARQRGADLNALRPVLDQMRQTEAAQRAAGLSLDKMGVSARQTQAALRGVPAQFTDIFTSIQGGQAPLTVFLQQGGQLKDMFGGAGPAARALGGYVLGLVNPFTLAAAAAAGLALAYNAGANESAAFERTVILSGQAAGVTAGQLSLMAGAVRDIGAGSRGQAAAVLNELAASGAVGAVNMERFTAAALRLQQVGGASASETAKAFNDLGREPLQAALKLNQSTNFLTQSVYDQIKALTDQGRTTDAARVAQEAYATAIEQRTPQLLQSLGYIERAWLGIKSATLGAVDATLNIGRSQTTAEAAAALRNRIASVQAGNEGGEGRSRLPELQAQLAAMQQGAKYEAQSAFYAAERAASVRAAVEWDKETDRYLGKQAQQSREIARLEQIGLAAGKSRAEIEQQIAAVREKFADKPAARIGRAADGMAAERDAAKEWAAFYERFSQAVSSASAKTDELTRSQAELVKFLQSPAYANMPEPARQLALQQAYAAVSAEQLAASTKVAARVAEDAAKAYGQWLGEIQRGADAAGRQAAELRDEAAAQELVGRGYRTLEEALQAVAIARLQERQVAMMGDETAVLALQKEIDARRELAGLLGARATRREAADAAKQAADDWKRTAERIESSLTDSLMRGFESGKGFAENLRDTVVNMFKTMVLRPVVSAIVSPIAGAITGALGVAGASVAGSAVAGGLAGQAGSILATPATGVGILAGLSGAAGAFGSGVASGLTAWGAGGSVTGLLGSGSALFAGGAANGLGVIAGALGPIALGLGAVAALVKAFDNSGTPHYGASSSFSAAGGLAVGDGVAGLGSRRGAYSAAVQDFTTQLTKSVVTVLDTTAATFGRSGGYTVSAAFADDKSKDPAQGALAIMRAGQLVAGSNTAFTRYADGAKGKELYLAAVVRDVRTALDSIGLPGWAKALLNNLNGAPTLDELAQVVTQINATQLALVALGQTLPQLANLTDTAVSDLLTAFGGIESLSQTAGSYYQAYYSDAERAAISTKQLQAQLAGLGVFTIPASREAFRSLVEAQDLSTASGRQMYAALLQLSPAFASVVQATADLTDAAQQAAAAQRDGLEAQLLQMQGDTASLRQRELAALAPQNRALQERIYALQDEQAAASQRNALEEELLQLQGDTVALRARELAALEPQNRALQERINALEDTQAAISLAADAASAAADLGAAWRSVGDTITDEVERIRNANGRQANNLAAAQAQFAVATAQARAGDQAAAARLPELSRTLLDLATAGASSAQELATTRASVAASLSQTAKLGVAIGQSAQAQADLRLQQLKQLEVEQRLAPGKDFGGLVSAINRWVDEIRAGADPAKLPFIGGFAEGGLHAGGLRIVGERGAELEATGPARIWTAEQTARFMGGSTSQRDLLAAVQSLLEQMSGMRYEVRATATHTAKLTRLHQDWSDRGLVVRTDADTPLATTVTP